VNKLPSISAPDDFEQQVFLRAALSSLSAVEASSSFEQNVLREVHGKGGSVTSPVSGTTSIVGIIAGIIGLLLITGGVVFYTSQPDVVTVRHVPVIGLSEPDLYDLQPVAVQEDLAANRAMKEIRARESGKKRSKPYGVAGYSK